MLRKIVTKKIPRSDSREVTSPLPLYIAEMFAILIKDGKIPECFTLFNNSSKDIFRSSPMTPSLKISLIRPSGSLHFPSFKDCKAISRSFICHAGVFFFFESSNLILKSSSCKSRISKKSGLAGLCLSLNLNVSRYNFLSSSGLVINWFFRFFFPAGKEGLIFGNIFSSASRLLDDLSCHYFHLHS